MASILTRFKDVISANIGELLDKAEDPAKMIDEYLRQLTEDLAKVKEETAGVMAEEIHAARQVTDNAVQVEKYLQLARKAVELGEDDDARKFLAKKQELEAVGEELGKTHAVAEENAKKIREMYDKLVRDIEVLNSRRATIKAKVAVAKTQERINDAVSNTKNATAAKDAFLKAEAKADAMLDKANAMTELNEAGVESTADLEKKYEELGQTKAVDEELAALKASMGK